MASIPKWEETEEITAPAPKWDDTEAYAPSWDNSEEVSPESWDSALSAIAEKHGVDKSKLKMHALMRGFDPEDEIQRKIKANESIVPDALVSTLGTAGEGLTLGLPGYLSKKFASEKEAKAMDDVEAEINNRKSLKDNMAEIVLGGVSLGSATKGLGKAATSAVNIGTSAAQRVMHSEDGKELEGAGEGAKIAMAFEAGLPIAGKVVGAGVKQASKFIPGGEHTYPLVNKMTAFFSSLANDATPEEIEQLLADPQARRRLLKTDLLDKTNKAIPAINDAEKRMSSEVSKAYENGKNEFLHQDNYPHTVDMGKVAELDPEAINRMRVEAPEKLNNLSKNSESASKYLNTAEELNSDVIDKSKQFFSGNTKRVFQNVRDIIEHGAPGDKAGQLQLNYTDELLKKRFLTARQHLDDLMKSKNWEGLNNFDRDYIQTLRDKLNEPLHSGFTNSSALKDVDNFYTQYMDDFQGFLKGMKTRGEDGADISKLYNDVRSSGSRGIKFDEKLSKANDWLESNKHRLDPDAVVEFQDVLSGIKDTRELGAVKGFQEKMGKTGGGPTSKAINRAINIGGAYASGGASLFLTPVTATQDYLNVMDKLVNLSNGPLAKEAKQWASMLTAAKGRGPTALAVTHMLLSKQSPEYLKALED